MRRRTSRPIILNSSIAAVFFLMLVAFRSAMRCKIERNFLSIAILALIAVSANGQSFPTVINTVAGGGSSENVPATSTAVAPAGLVVDGAGNLFVADFRNNRIRKVDPSGIITTVAGNGAASFSGDGGSATSASLNIPIGVVVDGAGNLFIADSSNHRIRKVDHVTQIITTVAGNGTEGFSGDGGLATTASLNVPTGVALDSSGNLYITDKGNNRLRKVDHTTQIITTLAGNGTGAFSGDGGPATSAGLEPETVAVDGSGNLFIADFANNRVRKVDTGGTITTIAGNGTGAFSGDGGPATSASLFFPRGVAFDSSGNLFIADANNLRIRKVDTAGTITTVAGNGNFSFSGDGGAATSAGMAPDRVGVDSAGNLFIADCCGPDPGNNRVRKVDHATQKISTIAGNGSPSFLGDAGPATQASLHAPQGVAQDSAGNLFVADAINNRIRMVDHATQTISTVAGSNSSGFSGDGGPATSAALSVPGGMAVDGAGNLFIADTQNQRIRKVDTGGTITTVAGDGNAAFSGDGGPATSASLNFPIGLALDGAGNLFIADSTNSRVRKVDTGGAITTVAGNGTFGFSGDGGPATAASVAGPNGVTIDTVGNLFIADTSNQRIRKVDHATQMISTVVGNGTAGFSGDGGPATSASLFNPFSVEVDSAGNLLIGDLGNNRVRKVASNGIISTIAGNGNASFSGDGGSATSAGLNAPAGLAVDSLGNFLLADSSNNRVRKVVTPPDFLIAASPGSASIKAGQSASFTFTVTPGGGFNSSVSFTSCSGLPVLTTCTFNPTAVTPNGNPVTVTVSVKTTGPNAALQPFSPRHKQQPLFAVLTLGGSLGMIGLILIQTDRRFRQNRRRRSSAAALSGVFLVVVLLMTLGCGGNSTPKPTPQTPVGTSTIVVTGTSGSISHSANVTVTVTQ